MKNLDKILEEIFALDKDLEKNKKEIKKIVKHLLDGQPEIKIDKKFVAQLKQKIKAESKKFQFKKNETIFSWFKKPIFAYSLSALVIVLTAFWTLKIQPENMSPKDGQIDLSLASHIEKTSQRAFGSLQTIATNSQNDSLSAPLGAGGGLETKSQISLLPRSGAINFKYEYKGEKLEEKIPENTIVYKRKNDNYLGKNLAKLLSQEKIMDLNLNQFKNLEALNISLTENTDYGHEIHLNLQDNGININQNWQSWPTRNYEERLTTNDLPAEKELIALSDNFLKKYNINMDNYGPGKLRTENNRYTIEEENGEKTEYISETASIVYPLEIEGQIVFDQNGQEFGIDVDINIKEKKVAGLRNYKISNFISSEYEAETDWNKILEKAETGGWQNFLYGKSEEEKEIIIELGTPELRLINTWKFNEGGSGEELFVPTYVFPVINKAENEYFYKNFIIVPLVKEMLTENNQFQPILERMPAIDTDTIE